MFSHDLKKSTFVAGVATLLIISCTCLQAAPTAAIPGMESVENNTSITINDSVGIISGRLSLGILNGESNELVFDQNTGNTISHLTWELENVMMVGAGLTVTPAPWITLNMDLWFNVSDGSGSMDDYDWNSSGGDWTDWSHHEDTEVDSYWLFDINAEMPFYKQPASTFYGILGVKRDNLELTASGGDYIYSSQSGVRDLTGSFASGVPGISYEQIMTTPYIGLGFNANYAPFTFSGSVIGSVLVNFEATDIHHLRNLEFEDDFETGTMFGIDLAVAYSFSDRLHLMGSFNYVNYEEVKGSTTITDLTDGSSYVIGGDVAGADNNYSLFMATLMYIF